MCSQSSYFLLELRWVRGVYRGPTRFLFSVVNSAVSWESEVFLSDDSLSEIEFWSNNVSALNGKIYWGVSVRFQSELAPACAMLPIQPAVLNLSLNQS